MSLNITYSKYMNQTCNVLMTYDQLKNVVQWKSNFNV